MSQETTKLENYLLNLNKHLKPVCMVKKANTQGCLRVILIETPYVVRTHIEVTSTCVDLIKSLATQYELPEPKFDITGRVFWF